MPRKNPVTKSQIRLEARIADYEAMIARYPHMAKDHYRPGSQQIKW